MRAELEFAEEWLSVIGYEGYEASNLGRIRSLARTVIRRDGWPRKIPGQILRPCFKSKYLAVSLYKNRKVCPCYIHLLVAEAFLGPKPAGTTVDHIDGDKYNNAAWNLQYVSLQENIQRGRKLRLWNKGKKLTRADVIEMRRLALEGMKQGKIAEKFGVRYEHVNNIIHQRAWKI